MKTSSKHSYTTWLGYYDTVIRVIPKSQEYFGRYEIRRFIKSLPDVIAPFELYTEVSKVLIDPLVIKDFSDKILFQNVVNITGTWLLSLYVLPRRTSLGLKDSFKPDVTPLVELYKFLINNYETSAKRNKQPIKNISKPVYSEFLSYGLTITYEPDRKEYELLVNELLHLLDLPNLYTEVS